MVMTDEVNSSNVNHRALDRRRVECHNVLAQVERVGSARRKLFRTSVHSATTSSPNRASKLANYNKPGIRAS